MTRAEQLEVELAELAESVGERARRHRLDEKLVRDALRIGILAEAAVAAEKAGE